MCRAIDCITEMLLASPIALSLFENSFQTSFSDRNNCAFECEFNYL